MMWGYNDGYGWYWGFGVLHMALYWGVLILLFLLLVKWVFGRRDHARRHGDKSALDILKERYARGEIGKDEFEQKRRDLEG